MLARHLVDAKYIINLYEINEKKVIESFRLQNIRFLRKVRHISELGIFTHINDTVRRIIFIKQLQIWGQDNKISGKNILGLNLQLN